MAELADLMKRVVSEWQFTPEIYPAMAGLYRGEKVVFSVKHSAVLHMAKSLAPVSAELLLLLASTAAYCESEDHKNVQVTREQREFLGTLAVKILINALGFASVVGLTPEEVEKKVGEILLSNNPKK